MVASLPDQITKHGNNGGGRDREKETRKNKRTPNRAKDEVHTDKREEQYEKREQAREITMK